MKNLSIRNLFGAFLGGMFGILMFAAFHWKGLPFGCLFGVVLGFWHREIGRLFIRSVRIQHRQRKPRKQRTVQDNMNRAQTIAMIIWCLGMAYGVLRIARSSPTLSNIHGILSVLAGIYFVIGLGIPVFFSIANKEFVAQTEAYQSLGTPLYVLRLLANFVYFFIGALFAICIIVMGLGTIGFITALVPWLCLQGIRIFWRMAMKAGHWPCLIVTIAVTSIVAHKIHPTTSHQATLWAAALISGLASGATILGIQHILSGIPRFKEDGMHRTVNGIDNRLLQRSVIWENRKKNFLTWMDSLSEPLPGHL